VFDFLKFDRNRVQHIPFSRTLLIDLLSSLLGDFVSKLQTLFRAMVSLFVDANQNGYFLVVLLQVATGVSINLMFDNRLRLVHARFQMDRRLIWKAVECWL